MPELPEVETVARQLAPVLSGRRIEKLQIVDQRLEFAGSAALHGALIRHVRRAGKQVALELEPAGPERGVRWLCVHLRMTGRLLWVESDAATPDDHVRARFTLDRGSLVFQDVRRFGVMQLTDTLDEVLGEALDPLSDELDEGTLGRLMEGSRQELKPWLLRQDRLVGLGNIYASEILFLAGLHPRRRAGSLRRKDVQRLHWAMRDVLLRAIECCGTTFSDFQDSRGEVGSFGRFLQVYGRQGEDCSQCATSIIRFVQQGRSTYVCAGCQGRGPRRKAQARRGRQ